MSRIVLVLALTVCTFSACSSNPPGDGEERKVVRGFGPAKDAEPEQGKKGPVVAGFEPPKKGAVNIDGIPRDSYFKPNSSIKAPRLGSLRSHPWWRQPMTDGKIGGIIFAISQLPIRQELLTVTSDGVYSTVDDDPFMNRGDVYAVLDGDKEATCLRFFGASVIPLKNPTPRSVVVSLLSQGLDAAYASEELHRRTGEGFAMFDRFFLMGKIKNYDLYSTNDMKDIKPGPTIKVP